MLSPGRVDPSGKARALSLTHSRHRPLFLERLESRLALSATGEIACENAQHPLPLQASSESHDEPSTSSVHTWESENVVRGWVGWSDRYDIYELEVSEASRLSIQLSRLSADLNLSLHDSQRNLLASSERPHNWSESLAGRISPGMYFVKIQPDQIYDLSAYELRVSLQSIEPERPPVVEAPPTRAPSPPEPSPPASDPGSTDVFPNVAYFGGQREWSLNAINAPEVWAQGYTGTDVVVAVVDTGIDLDHADLDANIWTNPSEIAGNGIDDDRNGFVDDVHGWDFWADDNSPNDANGHGTHVAGIIAGERNSFASTGVAYAAQVMPVQVLGSNGSGSMYDVAAGIRYAVDNGADIINLSLGSSASSQTVRAAINYANQHDVLIVAAAGNRGTNAPEYPARYGASFANVLSVGAFSSSEKLAGFSNRVGSSGVTQVDAPGVGVYSSYSQNRSATLSGTSMAAPQVAGLAALALSANQQLTAVELSQLIVEGADQNISRSDSVGAVNAARTVAQAVGFTQSTAASRAETAALAGGSSIARYRTQRNADPQFLGLPHDEPPTTTTSAAKSVRRLAAVAQDVLSPAARPADAASSRIISLFASDEVVASARQDSGQGDLIAATDRAFSLLDWLS